LGCCELAGLLLITHHDPQLTLVGATCHVPQVHVLVGCLCVWVGYLCVGWLSVCWLVVCVLVGCLCVGWLSVC
jgi:hypothetical protein